MDSEWDGSVLTGHPLIDEQHRQLHVLFEGLESAEIGADDPQQVRDVLDQLVEYSLSHFAMEEDLMRSEEYPPDQVAEHLEEHRRFTDFVRDQVLDYRAGRVTSVLPFVSYLRDWLAEHVHEIDRKLAQHVRERHQPE